MLVKNRAIPRESTGTSTVLFNLHGLKRYKKEAAGGN